jgi:lauroyl/myristoyl acyltransferase
MSRWYRHRFNTATSLRLILTIVPRVPRPLVPALGTVTTAVCLASMGAERRAAARNLRRILGASGWKVRASVWRLFYSFSRFMVSYCDLLRLSPDALDARLTPDPAGEARVAECLARGRGLIVLTAHLGNWEVGVRALERSGVPVNVVMRIERSNPAERWLQQVRARSGARVLDPTAAPEAILNLRAALARNEILAMQGDRASSERTLVADLFGAPFAFPVGPFLLAYACDAPLLPAFVLQDGWQRFRSSIGSPIRFPRSGDRDADLAAGVAQYARALEQVVREHPHQWFNFYELWPGEATPLPDAA